MRTKIITFMLLLLSFSLLTYGLLLDQGSLITALYTQMAGIP